MNKISFERRTELDIDELIGSLEALKGVGSAKEQRQNILVEIGFILVMETGCTAEKAEMVLVGTLGADWPDCFIAYAALKHAADCISPVGQEAVREFEANPLNEDGIRAAKQLAGIF